MPITVERGGWYIFTGFESPGRIESVLGQTVVASFLGEPNPDGSGSLESSREVFIWQIESRIENPEEIARLEAEAQGGKE